MTWETAKRISDFLMSLPVAEDEVIFDFIGGEPLLEIELIAKTCNYLLEEMKRREHPWLQKYSFRFTTNGINYSSVQVQDFVERYKEHLSVQMSIDGTKRKHDLNRHFANGKGSYDTILPSVRLWIEQFGEKAVSYMVVSHEDLQFLSESIIHLIQLGVKEMAVSLVVEDVWKDGDPQIYEKELMTVADYILAHHIWNDVTISVLRKDFGKPETDEHIYPCANPMYVFDAEGNIYTCVRFVDYSLRTKPARIIGHINSGIDYNKIRPFLSFDRESCYPKECLKCEIASGCRWCPAENYDSSDTGTIFQRKTTICQLHKANVRVKNYLWNKIEFIEKNERPKT